MPFCYETIYILLPDLDDAAVEAAKGRVAETVTAAGGRVYRRESWGRKRLAYTVAKQQRGNYQLVQYVGGAQVVADLERLFRLDEAFIKFLTVKLRKDPATVTDEGAEEVTREVEPAPDRAPRGRGRGRGRDEDAESDAESEAVAAE
jgi:small subunit ribosomal protein S6